jgi:type IV pilus assembly protein PilA
MKKGFTLVELLIVVAILGILYAIAIPQYQGYVTEARATAAKNNLRNIYMQQREYRTNNNDFYRTGAGCGGAPAVMADASGAINTNLFNNDNVLTNDFYNYCIDGAANNFTARAQLISDTTIEFNINNTNTTNGTAGAWR